MSRLQQPSSRSPAKSTSNPSTSRLARPTPTARLRAASPTIPARNLQASSSPSPIPVRLRTKSTPKAPSRRMVDDDVPPSPAKSALSIKEAIALKRAEAKKALSRQTRTSKDGDAWSGLEDAAPSSWPPKDENSIDVDMGRWTLREAIERAQSSGNINLSSRSLSCIPSALFEIHLGVKPEKLQLVSEEPPLSESRKKASNGTDAPAWFEQRDLEVLKAWNNEIVEIQAEISLFGSLKSVDLHNNSLASLPETFADLPSLTNLDLSHNQLTSFPVHFYALPALKTLNVSHNALTSLAFNSPFTEEASTRSRYRTDDFFTPAIVRADTALPRLISLHASHNKISAAAIDSDSFPQSIMQLDLSYNPITSGSGAAAEKLLSALANLPKLEQVHMKAADLDDRAFPSNLLHLSGRFEKIRLLDLEETQVTKDAVVAALSSLSRDFEFDVTAPDTESVSPSGLSPTEDVPKPVKIIVGKKVVREAWEVEADRRAKLRSMRSASSLRAAAQAQTEAEQPPPPVPSTSQKESPRAARPMPKVAVQREVVKEQWEIEAEQGLLTEGGRRRARALAAQQASVESSSSQNGETNASTLLKAKYWDEKNLTLSLPPVAPPNRLAHGRGFSLASSPSMGPGVDTDLALPIAALPLSLVVIQSFADTLRVLELKGRRADSSFMLPEGDGPFLPRLEELCLEGCNLGDEVSVVVGEEKKREPLFPTLARLLPNMRTLDLSLNLVTSQHLTMETLSSLVLSSPGRPGLKRLILRGNRLAGLDGFAALAKDIFASEEGDKARWTLEELDVRDNAIEKLNGELGLLPLEVFLVEGNVFRAPARRIWEREGTKGLLAWLRSRVE